MSMFLTIDGNLSDERSSEGQYPPSRSYLCSPISSLGAHVDVPFSCRDKTQDLDD